VELPANSFGGTTTVVICINPGLFDTEGATHADTYYKMNTLKADYTPGPDAPPLGLIRLGLASNTGILSAMSETLAVIPLDLSAVQTPATFDEVHPLRWLQRMGIASRDDACQLILQMDPPTFSHEQWGSVTITLEFTLYSRLILPVDLMQSDLLQPI
jgi:hypothetical protein